MSIHVVRSPMEESQKLTPEEVERLWDSLALADDAGQSYLEKRGLGDAVDVGLVRFTFASHPEKTVTSLHRNEYRLACLLTDVLGQARGIQVRMARDPRGDESAIRSVKGSAVKGAFFGAPHLIEAEQVVCVAEGMTDTLALAAWARGVCVVGAPTRGALAQIAKDLEAATTAVEGKLFALFPKNDRPKQESRREFVRLKQLLAKRGARVVLVATHEEYKDVAAWRQAHPEAEWPPAELRKALVPAPGDEAPEEDHEVLPPGGVVPIPAKFTTERFGKNLLTVASLLDDPMTREAIMGKPGEFSWNEMNFRVSYNGREIPEDDMTTMAVRIEASASSPDGKPLLFPEETVTRVVKMLARRRSIHPVRDWLGRLRWDGRQRLECELPGALGHGEWSFEGRLLRRWALSAVARAMEPGCKVDTVLVLTGNQKWRKSTFFEILGGDWFTDEPVEVGDKDGKLVMREAWLIEWGELSSMRGRDNESIKAFLSKRIDIFRRPYGRDLIRAPRHCVIVGSTNQEDYLSDPTGSRRFWTIKLSQRIDYSWVRQHREQLWAEAIALYNAAADCPACKPLLPYERCEAHQWWLTDEEDELRAEKNAVHEEQHQWLDVIRDWLDAHLAFAEVTPDQVLVEAVRLEHGKIRNSDQQAAGRMLRKLGWTRVRRSSGRHIRWVYVRGTEGASP